MHQAKLSKFFSAPKGTVKTSPVPVSAKGLLSPPSSSSKQSVASETIDLSSDTEQDVVISSSSISKSITEREFQEDPAKRRKLLHLLSNGRGEDEGEPWYNRTTTDPAASSNSKSSAPAGKVTYTPLEKQVVSIRQQYPDCLLMVECGYRMRFFGSDATIAAKVLSIYAHQDHNFMVASIPTHRTFIHCQRLLTAGHKVGIRIVD